MVVEVMCMQLNKTK